MEHKWQVRAHLDDYHKVVVYISKNFYNGKSEFFYIRDEAGVVTLCTLKSIENHTTYTKYLLQCPIDIDFAQEYDMIEEHGRSFPLQIGRIVKTKEFDEQFYYDGDDLGAVYSKESTTFSVWAPTATAVRLNLYIGEENQLFAMKRTEKGVYRVTVQGDLATATYTYLVKVDGKTREVQDPYSFSLTCNGKRSAVIDFDRCYVEGLDTPCTPLNKKTDAIIYEASVRDFTTSCFMNPQHRRGTFAAMIESGHTLHGYPIGFDYVKSLGITHIQLMPVCDFVTVDEANPSLFYNWGYDPFHYFALEGSYSTDPADPYCRVKEFRELVAKFHQANIRVNMDIVFNHVYDMDTSIFNRIVPQYYFRVSETGYVSNGSFCGNDLDSTAKMMRKLILDSCKHFIKHYGIDGFRFDLMGILDVDTVNMIQKECSAIKPDVMLYGEGWNMPTTLDDKDKAIQGNAAKMPEIGHFNDVFRNYVKGPSGEAEILSKGFCCGNAFDIYDVQSAMMGNCIAAYRIGQIYLNPTQSINYVECHDNQTCFDKISSCCPQETEQQKIARQRLIIGTILVSQGVPFFQIGQEFARTKNGLHNTYRSSDQINCVDWNRRVYYQNLVEYTRAAMALRKQIGAFRFSTKEEIENHVSFKVLENEVLDYRLHHVSDFCDYDEIRVVINPGNNEYNFYTDEEFTLIFDENGHCLQEHSCQIHVPGCSLRVYAK